MKRLAFVLLLATVPVWLAVSAGTILEADGLVEVQRAGRWVRAAAGDQVSVDAVIATGFRSRAIVALGSAVVTVGPLSQVVLEEVGLDGSGEEVTLGLPFGEIQAEVKRGSGGSDLPVTFQVLSPLSTAAVKGTVFTYDGVELDVTEGRVDLRNAYGQWHSVGEGQASRAYRWDISSVETTAIEASRGE